MIVLNMATFVAGGVRSALEGGFTGTGVGASGGAEDSGSCGFKDQDGGHLVGILHTDR